MNQAKDAIVYSLLIDSPSFVDIAFGGNTMKNTKEMLIEKNLESFAPAMMDD